MLGLHVTNLKDYTEYFTFLELIDPSSTDETPVVTDGGGQPEITTTTARPVIPSGNRLIFNGRSWVLYDISQLPDEYFRRSVREDFRIRFRTTNPEGLLWFSGNDERNMHLTMQVCVSDSKT